MEAGAGFIDEAGSGFAAVAGLGVGRHCTMRMMRAIIERIEMGADLLEFVIHPGIDVPDIAFGVVATGNATLVRHKDGEIATVVDVANGFLGAGYPNEVFGAVQVVDVDIEGAVAVEEDGFAAATFPVRGNLIHRFAVPLPHRGRLLIFHIRSNHRYQGSRRIL